jgi:aryl-alcohol dehydrogenase-like predicted oxidoreductase
MRTLTLPRTELRVSNLCFGTAEFGAGIDEATSFALLDQFVEAGGNFLDTAAIYADWTPAGKGSSERTIGKWLRSHPGDYVLATKGGHPEIATMEVPRLTKEQVGTDLDQSLSNLGVEQIDLYYLHRDDPSTPVADILGFLEEFVAEGKIRHYGFSNWKLPRAQEAMETAQAMGVTGFIANQPMWSLAEADLAGGDQTLVAMTEEYRNWHAQTGLAAIPYSSQALGYFNKLEAGKGLKGMAESLYDSQLSRSANRVRLMRIESLSLEVDLNVTQIVLGYLLSQPFPVVPIIGCKNAEQLADSLSAADVQLSAEQAAALVA